jgi:hypothetical protein
MEQAIKRLIVIVILCGLAAQLVGCETAPSRPPLDPAVLAANKAELEKFQQGPTSIPTKRWSVGVVVQGTPGVADSLDPAKAQSAVASHVVASKLIEALATSPWVSYVAATTGPTPATDVAVHLGGAVKSEQTRNLAKLHIALNFDFAKSDVRRVSVIGPDGQLIDSGLALAAARTTMSAETLRADVRNEVNRIEHILADLGDVDLSQRRVRAAAAEHQLAPGSVSGPPVPTTDVTNVLVPPAAVSFMERGSAIERKNFLDPLTATVHAFARKTEGSYFQLLEQRARIDEANRSAAERAQAMREESERRNRMAMARGMTAMLGGFSQDVAAGNTSAVNASTALMNSGAYEQAAEADQIRESARELEAEVNRVAADAQQELAAAFSASMSSMLVQLDGESVGLEGSYSQRLQTLRSKIRERLLQIQREEASKPTAAEAAGAKK